MLYALLGFFRALKRVGLHANRTINLIMLMLQDIGLTKRDLMDIKTDVVILYAEKDLVKSEHIAEMQGLIPGCESKMIKKTNHLSIIFSRAAIDLMKSFLNH